MKIFYRLSRSVGVLVELMVVVSWFVAVHDDDPDPNRSSDRDRMKSFTIYLIA